MPKVRPTDRLMETYELFKEGLMQVNVAGRMGISEQAVSVKKHKLIDAGYLSEIGNTGIFEPGPNAKFFEKATRIEKHLREGNEERADHKEPTKRSQPSDRQAVEDSVAKSHDTQPYVHLKEYDIEGLEAHMHGSIMYYIESVGNQVEAVIPDHGEGRRDIPLFIGPDNLNYHNNSRWDCDLQILARTGRSIFS